MDRWYAVKYYYVLCKINLLSGYAPPELLGLEGICSQDDSTESIHVVDIFCAGVVLVELLNNYNKDCAQMITQDGCSESKQKCVLDVLQRYANFFLNLPVFSPLMFHPSPPLPFPPHFPLIVL